MIEWTPGGHDGPRLVTFDTPRPRRVREKLVSVESAIGVACFGAGYLLAAWGPLGASVLAVLVGAIIAVASIAGVAAGPVCLALLHVLAALARP